MSCKTYKSMLHSYVGNELSDLEESLMRRHLEDCRDCRQEILEIKRLQNLMPQIKEKPIYLAEIKGNVMAAIKSSKAVRTVMYDSKVLWHMGISMIACGLLVFAMNFIPMTGEFASGSHNSSFAQHVGQKLVQPIAVLNKGLVQISNNIVDLNGITFRLEQKIRGGM